MNDPWDETGVPIECLDCETNKNGECHCCYDIFED